jgi:hypothetical protein
MDNAFCPVCQHEAVVGQGGTGGLLQLFHQAAPMATTKRQKREILALGQKVLDAQLSDEQTRQEAQKMSPESRDLFFKWSNFIFGAVSAGTGLGVLILQLAGTDSTPTEREAMSQTAQELLKKATLVQGAAPMLPKRNQKRNRASGQAQNAGTSKRTGGKAKHRGSKKGDVPLGE